MLDVDNVTLQKETKLGTEIIVAHHSKKRYLVWNQEVSKTQIKSLIDRNYLRTKTITVGKAQIVDNLLKHQHSATEIYYVTKGNAKLHLGDKIYDLEPEKVVYLPSGIPHFTEIVGNNPLEILYIFAKDSIDDVEYIFDNSVDVSPSSPRILSIDQGLPSKSNTLVRTLLHETDPHEQGLQMDHIQIPQNNSFQTENEFVALMYVSFGFGKLYIDDETVNILKGSYAYIPNNVVFRIENEDSSYLSILSFHALPQ